MDNTKPRPRGRGSDILSLLRVQQWVKNVFVLLPLFFAGRLCQAEAVLSACAACVAFCLASSAVYCFNDVVDAKADAAHPQKCRRPVASGRVRRGTALAIGALMACGAFAEGLLLQPRVRMCAMAVLAAYLALNVAYSLWLKRYAIVDVFVIALGFVLRVAMGGIVCEIWLSPWIVCLTFLLTLFLAFAKRRDDVAIYESSGLVTRANIVGYNLAFMNQTLGLLGAITIVCYIIYSVQPDVEARIGSRYVYVTSVFVLAGILRYLQLAIVDVRSGSPTRVLLTDRFIGLCVLGWICTFMFIIYL